MEEISLFEHNEIALKRLNDALTKGKCATINHATGTGKSFIILKYITQNKNKRFLYIAPTYQILDQLIEDAKKLNITLESIKLDQLIYRNLLDMDMKELFEKYDEIVFDEYHRCGAKETFYKIKELKTLLNESSEEKKFIGLTATPIRYLDKERNMTKEIFDGVEASNLTLAEAMCDELLPIPNYYISSGTIIKEAERVRNKIENLPDSQTKNELLKQLDSLDVFNKYKTEAHSSLFKKYMNQKDGKYILFCRDTDSLDAIYLNINRWFKNIDLDNVFIVHSHLSDEEKTNNLEAFNNKKGEFSILLCIDILNEGVHIEGVDGVILNRRTSSPIIYFQQIGRALSFSGRKKEIQVFDLVYNYGNHEAIYTVYDEFKNEIKRRIKKFPENSEKYQTMLGKFNIVDESKEMLGKIHAIARKINDKTLIKARLENAIWIIEKYIKENQIEEEFFIDQVFDEDVIRAYYTIEKYYKFITNSQFEKLQKTGFIMPPELFMTLDERKSYLGGFDSIYEKEKNESILVIEDIIKFINQNGRTPQENSNDFIERNVFELYKQCLLRLDYTQFKKMTNVITINDVELNPWEKILMQIKPSNDDVLELINQAMNIVKDNESLPKHIYKALQELILKYEVGGQDKIIKLLKYSDKIDTDKKKALKEQQFQIINSLTQEIFDENNESPNSVLTKMEELVSKLDKTYYALFQKKYERRKKLFVRSSFLLRNEMSMYSFCKNIINEPLDRYPKIIADLKLDIKLFNDLEKVYIFMKEHDDRLPSPDIEEEKELCRIINNAISTGMFSKKVLRFGMFEMKESETSRTNNILKEILDNEGKNPTTKYHIAKMIFFIRKHDRKPCENSPDKEERQLLENYSKYVVENISKSQQLSLSFFMNRESYLRNTISQRSKFASLKNEQIEI